jgi:tRNA threonylcarbamoyladenosine biosynthesis protein TsaE
MRLRHIRTTSPAQTKQLGALFAKKMLGGKASKRALILALEGELGSGKTTFLQGFARALGIPRITSPTFLLSRAYPIKESRTLYHIDCYRVQSGRELVKLGFRDWISHPDHIIVIEWAEKVKNFLPKNTIRIRFYHGKKQNERIILISA